jgi:hypothetical protein
MLSYTARQMFSRLRYRRKWPASRHLSVQPVRREVQRLTLVTVNLEGEEDRNSSVSRDAERRGFAEP